MKQMCVVIVLGIVFVFSGCDQREEEGVFYLSSEYRSGEEYLEALAEKGYLVDETVADLLKPIADIPEEQVRLKKVVLRDLGLPNGGTLEDIFYAVEAQGLDLCPPWVALQYRLACADGESAYIGMNPLFHSESDTQMFYVYRYVDLDPDRWLNSMRTRIHWESDSEWLFVSSDVPWTRTNLAFEEEMFHLSAEHRSGEEYIEVLKEKGYAVEARAEFLLRQLTSIGEEYVRLKRVTVGDLGLSHGGTTYDVLIAAKAHGFQLCPTWVGPQYRMECDDRFTAIGMDPLTGPRGYAHVFYVNPHDHDRWFGTRHLGHYWHPDFAWLFVSLE